MVAGGRAERRPPERGPKANRTPAGVPEHNVRENAIMPSTYTSLHFHIVFCTKHREPCIDTSWRPRLHEYLGGTVRGLGGVPGAVGGTADHVHILAGLRPTQCLSDLVR